MEKRNHNLKLILNELLLLLFILCKLIEKQYYSCTRAKPHIHTIHIHNIQLPQVTLIIK